MKGARMKFSPHYWPIELKIATMTVVWVSACFYYRNLFICIIREALARYRWRY